MNEAGLSVRLRALREPPPGSEFEQRLEQALWREAQALRAERNRGSSGTAVRARRWSGRGGLAIALVLGASAAAAAGSGVWAWLGGGEPVAAPAPVPQPVEARQRPAAASARGQATPPEPPPEAAISDQGPSAVRPEARRIEAPVSQPGPLPASSRRAELTPPAARSLPAARALTPEVVRLPEAAASIEMVPLDLPARGLAGTAAGRERAAGSAALPLPNRSGDAARSDRRKLPELPARSDRRRARPERPDLERAGPPGRAIARERSGRDTAERGLERAREARERK
ncbi:MAG: hypothetical protein ABI895_23345 [Deltaproteobacteria bacterium]